ncbi:MULTISPECIES: colanic acid biosynthesis glycosyltransferase WcaA [Kosakonia]|jgi:colanic acid biosynthesis glycosyl transferase WcaA|uniref:Colanic acid biosynthesis glycosyltransferase WcaA n=1 Tax=Kosakonia cowanii JCM 10956 = DSM 18146 TaxID=1300165 RepID=A0A807LN36_9ENTR|nr:MULTISPECIES: colanic acid biosynthesis glycosyltransferase WcaA [Kosakonia]MDP9767254.1 colanic acid biosynthesis glycosyl transferase WcaA [Atlantibacter hermannii]MDT3412800.1 colanic acid biosynthesis glycosyl transferase WcaA [Atlantibacter sp. SORGH_AS_0304]APZ07195.1 colanic acid biosynthesis glycosyltransferase WcaA [Kosakonia cowanii JCM 10956 = DSM 18146]MBK0017457.1 colanic acid biosynthesis glycosyltransferase WcaA [Kosakonia sp. S42]MDF7760013.1 colanic acid biosynthesis glycos
MSTTANPLISIYMPTWNRQQLAIRAIKSVLRQDYPHWEMIIVDDCSASFDQLQQFVDELGDPRVSYTRNDFNSGACAVRNQAILQARGQYITGIDDDDEWTPNRLSVFLAHKHLLNTRAFLYANDYVCQGEVYAQPASLPLYPKSPFSRKLFYKRNIVGNQVFTWAWRFKESLFDTQLKAAQDYDIFLRMVTEYGEPFKIEEATQILHINHGEMQITSSPKKFSGYFHFYRKHKDKFDRASKKYQLFTLYQIRNKRMNWRTLLTLFSVRNGKRLADGLRGK